VSGYADVSAVFLWQADGPEQGGRGVSGDREAARRAAEKLLRSGEATAAVIEEAELGLGTRALTFAYCPTGPRWQAMTGPRGRVRWVPDRTRAGAR
jgi:hypothetical protein